MPQLQFNLLTRDQRRIITEALGAASACWEKLEGAGIFESDRCLGIANELADTISDWIVEERQPNLGLATTRQLLDEIRSRIEVDYYSGGGGLEYTTAGGRPELQLDAPED